MIRKVLIECTIVTSDGHIDTDEKLAAVIKERLTSAPVQAILDKIAITEDYSGILLEKL